MLGLVVVDCCILREDIVHRVHGTTVLMSSNVRVTDYYIKHECEHIERTPIVPREQGVCDGCYDVIVYTVNNYMNS